MAKNNLDQSLVKFVTELQSLNDTVNIDSYKKDIDEIIKDPKQYGNDLIEIKIVENVRLFLQAYKLGSNFGKEVMKNGK